MEVTYRITQIEQQKRNEGRVNIYLDGAFAFGLEQEVILQHHLHEGDKLSENIINEVLLSEERTRAKEKALTFLSYRARSVEELKKKLEEREFSERTIRRVIDDFLRAGLLDDRKFSSSYIYSRMIRKPMAKRLLKQELISKGIREDITEEAIEDGYGNRSEVEVARDLVLKRIRRYKQEDEKKIKKKLSEFLFRRGFDWEVIEIVLNEVTGEMKI
jgi:regulatory protein